MAQRQMVLQVHGAVLRGDGGIIPKEAFREASRLVVALQCGVDR